MGCLALKRKPCGVVAHVIDQDLEPEEWSEVYEALRNAHLLKKKLKYRRTASQYRAIDSEQPRVAGNSFQDEGLLLRLSNTKGVCKSGRGRMNVFASQSPEAEPLLELETFGWSKESGLRLRSAKSGKLLMTLVPVKRPTYQRTTVLPQECRLPAIGSEELADTWELCRIYADGRVVASVRCCTEEEPLPPPSCWHNIMRSHKPKRQTFRVWVAAQGAIEANCSRCPSFKTDSSGHELTWALGRGLGLSGFQKAEEVMGGKKSELQKEVAEYWESIANAQRKWNETSVLEVVGEKTSVDDRSSVVPRSEEAVGIVEVLDRRRRLGRAGLTLETEESSLGPGHSERAPAMARLVREAKQEEGQVGKQEDEGAHEPRQSLDSMEAFFECRSGRNSESGSEASGKEVAAEGLLADEQSGEAGTSSEPRLRSRSAEFFRESGESRHSQSRSSKYLADSERQADADRRMDNEINGEHQQEAPPLRSVGMLASFRSGQKSGLAKELERPLLSYRSSGLEFDPATDVRILEPHDSALSDRVMPSAFITSAMVPLVAEVARERFGRLEITFRSTSSSVRLGESVIALARGSGYGWQKRMKVEVSATCSADALALVVLTKYLGDVFDSVLK